MLGIDTWPWNRWYEIRRTWTELKSPLFKSLSNSTEQVAPAALKLFQEYSGKKNGGKRSKRDTLNQNTLHRVPFPACCALPVVGNASLLSLISLLNFWQINKSLFGKGKRKKWPEWCRLWWSEKRPWVSIKMVPPNIDVTWIGSIAIRKTVKRNKKLMKEWN